MPSGNYRLKKSIEGSMREEDPRVRSSDVTEAFNRQSRALNDLGVTPDEYFKAQESPTARRELGSKIGYQGLKKLGLK
ncbi:MAG: hypothetical protein GF347_04535 [Candidatus Moranbacteria bacterium]|nr:hypothetical protein [Candidatus Moranbacteria bacterium]